MEKFRTDVADESQLDGSVDMFQTNEYVFTNHLEWLEENYSDSDQEYEMILLMRKIKNNAEMMALLKKV